MTKKKTAALFPELPTWIDPATWAEFEAHRMKIRKPMTDYARRLIVLRLDGFRLAGHDVNSALNRSIELGYPGVFAPKVVAPRQQSFRERDSENKAARFAEMTGGRRRDDLEVVTDVRSPVLKAIGNA